jgi:hypothetical protein
MAQQLQITFDCANPILLAQFWAQALGYQLQPPPEGFASWEEWEQKYCTPEEVGSFAAIIDPDGHGSRILFQRVPETKRVKNRVHLDVNASRQLSTSSETEIHAFVDAEVERLKTLGAHELHRYNQYDQYWVTMADPEGNEFCIQ